MTRRSTRGTRWLISRAVCPCTAIEGSLAPKFGRKERHGQVIDDHDILGTTTGLVGTDRGNAGHPKTPIRLLASLRYLKHSFNLVAARTAHQMRQRGPQAVFVEIAGCGHAPTPNTLAQWALVEWFFQRRLNPARNPSALSGGRVDRSDQARAPVPA